MEFVALFAGLAGLWLGTKATIRGAVSVAERLGISEFVIGVVVLSVGSDLPELAIAVDAGIKNLGPMHTSDIVVGSALGSTLGQIGFVLGIAGLVHHLHLPRKVVIEQGIALLGSAFLLGVVGWSGYVSRFEGWVLIAAYLGYLYFIVKGATEIPLEEEYEDVNGVAMSAFRLMIGLVIVGFSAELTVDGATGVAETLDVEQAFVAIVIIGLGSSLPELSISLGAAMEKRVMLSVGNLLGSNVFDTLVPVGVAAAIAGLDFREELLQEELGFLIVLTAVVMTFFLKKGIRKREGMFVLGFYLAYVMTELLAAK